MVTPPAIEPSPERKGAAVSSADRSPVTAQYQAFERHGPAPVTIEGSAAGHAPGRRGDQHGGRRSTISSKGRRTRALRLRGGCTSESSRPGGGDDRVRRGIHQRTIALLAIPQLPGSGDHGLRSQHQHAGGNPNGISAATAPAAMESRTRVRRKPQHSQRHRRVMQGIESG